MMRDKKVAAIIVAKMGKPRKGKAMGNHGDMSSKDKSKYADQMGKEMSPDDEYDDEMSNLDYASKDVMESLESGDAESFRDSLKAFVELCIDKYESEMENSHNSEKY